MKKSNKGFSMVELIIVIAIMAILAGALAPALIKYINKSRISTDIQTANTIATAIQTALANENGFDHAPSPGWTTITWDTAGSDAFWGPVTSSIGGSQAPKIKAKKCLDGTAMGSDFQVYVDAVNNVVGVSDGVHMLFPTADECLTDDTKSHTSTFGTFPN